jgi:hypothetical protein
MSNRREFEKIGLNETGWYVVRIDDPRKINDLFIAGLKAVISEHDLAGEIWSRGQFFVDQTEIYRAWGVKHEPHCRYHSVLAEPDIIYEGCPNVKIETGSDDETSILVTTPINTYRYVLKP